MDFLTELENYENKWVALVKDGDSERIVGSGDDAVSAKHSAEANGFSDPILYRVNSFEAGYIPYGRGLI